MAHVHAQPLRVRCGRQHLLPHLLKPGTLCLRTLDIHPNLRLPTLQPLIHPVKHKLNLFNIRDRSLYRHLLFLGLLLILGVRVRRAGNGCS